MHMSHSSIAVIGAGMAGLACAQRLAKAGRTVRVFDKGRGPGGRMATRRVEYDGDVAQFDHGAQFFTAREIAFRTQVDQWIAQGALARWDSSFVKLSGESAAELGREPRYVGTPSMNGLTKFMAAGLDVTLSTAITKVDSAAPRGWMLHAANGASFGPFDGVVVAVPAEQAAPLLAPIAQDFAAQAQLARTAPCWTGLFAFAQPPAIAFDAIRFGDHPVLDWAAHDNSKPMRASAPSCWVVNARVDWTRANLEASPETAIDLLQKAFASQFPNLPAPVIAQAHRWRYAQVETPTGTAFSWNDARGIGVCGDWRLGARVELAWRSGHELAQAVLG